MVSKASKAISRKQPMPNSLLDSSSAANMFRRAISVTNHGSMGLRAVMEQAGTAAVCKVDQHAGKQWRTSRHSMLLGALGVLENVMRRHCAESIALGKQLERTLHRRLQ